MIIDLRSDTVTKPSKGMLAAMMDAKVGDDVFREDETVNQLETRIANMFGKPSALFFPSGTMANQVAIKLHTNPGDQVINLPIFIIMNLAVLRLIAACLVNY